MDASEHIIIIVTVICLFEKRRTFTRMKYKMNTFTNKAEATEELSSYKEIAAL